VTPDPAAVERYRALIAGQREEHRYAYVVGLLTSTVRGAARALSAGDRGTVRWEIRAGLAIAAAHDTMSETGVGEPAGGVR